jgi:hypothetical protein
MARCLQYSTLTGRNAIWLRAERQRIWQATETDWLTRARDNSCAEQFKTLSPSYASVTLTTYTTARFTALTSCFRQTAEVSIIKQNVEKQVKYKQCTYSRRRLGMLPNSMSGIWRRRLLFKRLENKETMSIKRQSVKTKMTRFFFVNSAMKMSYLFQTMKGNKYTFVKTKTEHSIYSFPTHYFGIFISQPWHMARIGLLNVPVQISTVSVTILRISVISSFVPQQN